MSDKKYWQGFGEVNDPKKFSEESEG